MMEGEEEGGMGMEEGYDNDGLLKEDTDCKDNTKLFNSLHKILQIKRKGKDGIRREAVKDVGEFGAVKNKASSSLNKLLESIQEDGEEKAVNKVSVLVRTKTQKEIKTLETPLEKPQALRAKRTVLYDHAKEEVSRFNAIVYHNRVADQLVFPHNSGKKVRIQSSKERVEDSVPMTPLEEDMARILYGEEYVKQRKAELEKPKGASEAEAYALSVEEALNLHSEMARLRAQQSYQMAKAKRQKKIKSKTYHRILRKEKIRKQLEGFEELQKKDPEAAMLKLEELNKSRISERMSLKHRNTSKWAKMQAARAKYNKESRIALSQQLDISKQLTQKVQESSDEEDDTEMEFPKLVKSSLENPWMLQSEVKNNEKLQLYYTGYKKLWEEINAKKTKEQKKQQQQAGSSKGTNDGQTEKSTKMKEGDADEIRELNVDTDRQIFENEEDNVTPKKGVQRDISLSCSPKPKQSTTIIDPSNYLKISKKKSKFDGQVFSQLDLDDGSEVESEGEEGEGSQRKLIAEAFEDDNVVSEFQRRKQDEVDASKPTDIDLSLPGWGEWGGKGITPNPKKKNKFIIKAPPAAPRKDAHLSHLILNEEAGTKMKEHLVCELPFPFQRVKDFEKTVRAPIGRTWQTEKTMKDLIAPKVITRLGSVIEPLNENVLAKSKDGSAKELQVPVSLKRLARVKKHK